MRYSFIKKHQHESWGQNVCISCRANMRLAVDKFLYDNVLISQFVYKMSFIQAYLVHAHWKRKHNIENAYSNVSKVILLFISAGNL